MAEVEETQGFDRVEKEKRRESMAEVEETATTEAEVKGEDTESESPKTLTPWEQHAGVILIPRFDYNAPSSLLHHSHSGFLITCTIKREKSATKEAISILEKFVGCTNGGKSDDPETSDANVGSKRQKICAQEIDSSSGAENKSISSDSEDTDANANAKNGLSLSLVKLTRSGLLLFTFPRDSSPDTTGIVASIVQALESKNLKSPLWCHRILPFQATCSLNETELRAVTSKLVRQFVNDKQNKLTKPVKFAVGYNRRGIEETELKVSKDTCNDSNSIALLDRNKCFSVVAAAVKDVVSDAVVDLKAPELSVLIEWLPLSRVPNGSLVVAVSVLPQKLVSTKQRLGIRALVADNKAKSKAT